MKAIFSRITAFFLAILAFFGLSPKQAKPEVTIGNDGYAIVERGVQFSFAANATTGYSWEQKTDGSSVKLSKAFYTAPKDTGMVGVGGTQYYDYRAVKPGTTTITFTYQRAWENNPPAKTYVAVVVVADDLSVTVKSFTAQ